MSSPPPGFVLDEPQGSGVPQNPPPDGFILDQIQDDPPENMGVHQAADTLGFGSVTRFGEGIKLGLKNASTGARQLGNYLDFNSETRDEDSEMLKSEVAARDLRIGELGNWGYTGSLVGETLPSAILPGGPTGGIVRRVAGGVAADVASSVADPVREDETRVGNLERAALFSGGLRTVGSSISAGFRRVSNARSGNFADPEVKKLVDDASAEDIRLFFDDASQNTFAQQASVTAEILGRAGTGWGRARQNEDALAAANRWLQKYSGDFDDYAEVMQTGLGRKLDIFKREASRKYARVANEIGEAGEVPTGAFDRAAESGIAAEAAKGTRGNNTVTSFIERFRDSPRGDFQQMIEFRSDLNKEIRGLLSDNADINKTSIDSLMSIKRALDDDMSSFATANGADVSWRAANDFYRNTVVQFQRGKLKNLVNDDSAANFDDQAAWRYLVQTSTNPKRARLLWQSLDRQGREAVRFGMISEAMDAATAGGGPFSPAKFAGYIEKRMPVAEQFFRGQSREELTGLVNVMRHIERAGQFAENPPTGKRAIPLLLAGGAYFEPGTVGVVAGVGLTIKGLFQTKAGRNLLLSASTATPGSRQFDAIMQNLEKVAARGSN